MKRWKITIPNNLTHTFSAETKDDALEEAYDWIMENIKCEECFAENAVDGIQLTNEILKIIKDCPVQSYSSSDDCCLKKCVLAEVCYKYWIGEELK